MFLCIIFLFSTIVLFIIISYYIFPYYENNIIHFPVFIFFLYRTGIFLFFDICTINASPVFTLLVSKDSCCLIVVLKLFQESENSVQTVSYLCTKESLSLENIFKYLIL